MTCKCSLRLHRSRRLCSSRPRRRHQCSKCIKRKFTVSAHLTAVRAPIGSGFSYQQLPLAEREELWLVLSSFGTSSRWHQNLQYRVRVSVQMFKCFVSDDDCWLIKCVFSSSMSLYRCAKTTTGTGSIFHPLLMLIFRVLEEHFKSCSLSLCFDELNLSNWHMELH